jgi:hypothetical protein
VTAHAADALAARGGAPLGKRTSSPGGLLALHAAAADPRVRDAVAICHARPDRLAERLGEGRPRDPSPERSERLRIVLGGGHRTLQHDPTVLADTVGFLAGHLGAGQVAHRSAAN